MGQARCGDCGAVGADVTCAELFDRLLALDHSRRQPWGALHGEAVACYFLQHPHAPRAPRDPAPLYVRLERFIAADPADGAMSARTTIHDVAVDGTFPAVGYGEWLRRWAGWIVGSRTAE